MNQKKLSLIKDYITIKPGVEHGKPLLKGTRLPVSFILDQFVLGWNIKEIKSRYPEINYWYLVKIVKLLSKEINKLEDDKPEAHNTWSRNIRCEVGTTL
ncbi:DUF433 domain-containing protein [Candidatus Roizmanbacteria bacterium]|nr:DUF433 domain-containing protein [Candidatus Roizmanbacteria bacterium]